MGSHYTSIHVQHTDQRGVVGVVEDLVRGQKEARVLVGPVPGGWVGVYPNDTIGSDEFSLALSKRTETTVLMLLLHDGDLILYNHFLNGKLVDEYSTRSRLFRGGFA